MTIVLDRAYSGGSVLLDRWLNLSVAGIPRITAITGAQDGEPLTLTGEFDVTDNTVWIGVPDDEDNTAVELAIDTQSDTEIVTEPLDASFLWLTKATTFFVRNSDDVASNVVSAAVAPKATERVFSVTQEYLGDPSTRIESFPPLSFGDEIRIRNVTGVSLGDLAFTGQGAFNVSAVATDFEAAVFDGEGLGGWATQTLLNLSTTASVPNVLTLTQAAATAAIQSSGLLVNVIDSVPSASVGVGRVVAQFPQASSIVSFGSTVELTLSLGNSVVLVPVLTGMPLTEAIAALAALGLAYTSSNVIDGIGSGLVAVQSVAPGTLVDVGATVGLAVSARLMPNLFGLLLSEAQALISSAGLVLVTTSEGYSNQYGLGEVIAQSPAVGDVVTPGQNVLLTVSIGSPSQVPVQPSGLRPFVSLREFLL